MGGGGGVGLGGFCGGGGIAHAILEGSGGSGGSQNTLGEREQSEVCVNHQHMGLRRGRKFPDEKRRSLGFNPIQKGKRSRRLLAMSGETSNSGTKTVFLGIAWKGNFR